MKMVLENFQSMMKGSHFSGVGVGNTNRPLIGKNSLSSGIPTDPTGPGHPKALLVVSKPSNLLINSQNQVKHANFRAGRILALAMDPCNSSVGVITYMSSEWINTDLNHDSYDGYAGVVGSLGLSILECFLGRFPFSGIDRQGEWASLMCAICYSPPPEAPTTASKVFRSFIGCCLQKDPAKWWTAVQLLTHPFVTQAASPQLSAPLHHPNTYSRTSSHSLAHG